MSKILSSVDVSNRLKQFMKKISASGKDMAKMGRVTEQAYSGYLQEKNLPSANALMQWAENAGMNINWLLTGEGEMLRHQDAPMSGGEAALIARMAEMEERVRELKYAVELQKQLLEKQDSAFLSDTAALGGSGATSTLPGGIERRGRKHDE